MKIISILRSLTLQGQEVPFTLLFFGEKEDRFILNGTLRLSFASRRRHRNIIGERTATTLYMAAGCDLK